MKFNLFFCIGLKRRYNYRKSCHAPNCDELSQTNATLISHHSASGCTKLHRDQMKAEV